MFLAIALSIVQISVAYNMNRGLYTSENLTLLSVFAYIWFDCESDWQLLLDQ